jgi:transcriptional regulator with XRE-family HTH domain
MLCPVAIFTTNLSRKVRESPMEKITSDLAFGRFLKFWRGVHGLSQEELAHRINSSPRHISRMENGSSRPSAAIVMAIAEELKLGKRDSNHLLVAAGYVPAEEKLDFNAPELKWLRKAMTLTLRALDPYPTTLTDSSTNFLMVNRGWVGFFLKNVPQHTLDTFTNHYDFLFSRKGAGNIVSNWEDTLSVILMTVQQRVLFTNDPADEAIRNKLASHPNLPPDWQQRAARIEPMASFRVQIELDGRLQKFFSVNRMVDPLGPAALGAEPHFTINTLYPEDENLDLSGLIEGELKHPLLFY